ncbi:hypothetical protein [Neorhizobium sp. DAR64861/K0K2]|uniref:hypothetical protein n=1 Tax=unclassified Neorhizobium TaxID=2629175 RepID=UPI003D272E25
MSIVELVHDLQSCREPDRELDTRIAEYIGYEKRVEAPGTPAERVTWHVPWDPRPTKIPHYTRVIDHAIALLHQKCPGQTFAFSWRDDELAHAKIATDEPVAAVTAAAAICLAVFRHLIPKGYGG